MQVEFRSPAVIADPFPALKRLREEDPVHWSAELDSWVLTRYDDVALGFRDERFSADRIRPFVQQQSRADAQVAQTLGRSISLWAVFNDPPVHTRLRKLLNKGFSPAAINALRGRIEAIVDELLDAVLERGEMDVIADFAYPLPATVIGEILGVPRADIGLLKRWSDDIAAFVLVSRANPDKYRAAAASITEMNRYFADVIAARRKHAEGKVIDHLIAAHDDDNDALTLEELVASCVLLLFAGHETTTNFIGNALLALLRHPEQLHELRAGAGDENYLSTALNELLRWDGPTLSMARVMQQDVALHGKRLASGQRVYLFATAANRDPAMFADPDRLDLRREAARKHLTFGHGIHTCLGAHLARVEGAVALRRLLQRTQALQLRAGALRWSDSLVIRGMKALPVSFEPA
jgi:cytochrome P450